MIAVCTTTTRRPLAAFYRYLGLDWRTGSPEAHMAWVACHAGTGVDVRLAALDACSAAHGVSVDRLVDYLAPTA